MTIRELAGCTMSAGELIAELELLDRDTPVLFATNYGDIGNTQQVLPIGEVLDVMSGNLYETGYSQSGIALREDDGEGDYADDDDRDKDDEIEIAVIQA